MLDIARLRAQTRGTAHVIHFNNAGASLMPDPVVEMLEEYLRAESALGGYEMQDHYSAQLDQVYQSVANMLHCKPGEVALLDSNTTGWDRIFYSLPFSPGDRILTSTADYSSNFIAYIQMARRKQLQVEIIPEDEHGQLSIQALENMMDERVRLIAISHIPTNSGLVNPAAEVGRIARRHNACYLLDGCQSAGQMPLDMQQIGCDAYSATGRKFMRGPRGTGFLYVSERLLEWLEPFSLDMHAADWTGPNSYRLRADARRFETWERNIGALLGLGKAVDYALETGLEKIWQRIVYLSEYLRSQLAEIPGVKVRDRGQVRCGIVTFTVEGQDIQALHGYLRSKKINTMVSLRNNELLGIGHEHYQMIRASVHYYNTEEEIHTLCQTLRDLPRNLSYTA